MTSQGALGSKVVPLVAGTVFRMPDMDGAAFPAKMAYSRSATEKLE
jgi:hypothetical protein